MDYTDAWVSKTFHAPALNSSPKSWPQEGAIVQMLEGFFFFFACVGGRDFFLFTASPPPHPELSQLKSLFNVRTRSKGLNKKVETDVIMDTVLFWTAKQSAFKYLHKQSPGTQWENGRVEAPAEIRVLTIAVAGLYFIPPVGSTLPKMRQTFKKQTANITI